MNNNSVPIIDVSPLTHGSGDKTDVAKALRSACRQYGFFYITGHSIPIELQQQLEEQSRLFFALEQQEKLKIRMALGGKAWRGFFPVGEELTSGIPDLKEGLYFGSELDASHPKVVQKVPLHGANLFPDQVPALKQTVLDYIEALTRLGHQLMEGIALSLDLDAQYFVPFIKDPLTLFRIFHYPSHASKSIEAAEWGVGEHTDYGLLTILKQDAIGGLQVKTKEAWIEAPYIENTFICNIGDMLDRMTGGYYCSTPHRVKNKSTQSRFSFPFFFDPNFDIQIKAIDLRHLEPYEASNAKRWDEAELHEFEGTYGAYVLNKVSKVFPEL